MVDAALKPLDARSQQGEAENEGFPAPQRIAQHARAESLPYVVLEGAAARLPMIATRVGGMAEIFGTEAHALVPPGNPQALAAAIVHTRAHPGAAAEAAQRLQERVRTHFSVDAMTQAVLAAYAEGLARRPASGTEAPAGSLNILHVLRAPVGGLFRHVLDLVRGQHAQGHRIGVVADASTGGPNAEECFAGLAPHLALGLTRVALSRQLGLRDVSARAHVARRALEIGADVVHGHGAKGGAYARLARSPRAIRAYTPHGGSLHYAWSSPAGAFYLASERLLMRRTDLFLFESGYGRAVFEAKLGRPRARVRVVHNGVAPEEFVPVAAAADATDLVFVGELRSL